MRRPSVWRTNVWRPSVLMKPSAWRLLHLLLLLPLLLLLLLLW
jgi:hypothetical protein